MSTSEGTPGSQQPVWDTQGAFSLFPSRCDSCAGVNLDHCFGLLYIVNAVCIYFLPILVSAPQGWSVYISTTGWKWVSACLIKSIMLPQTLYPLKQLREAWNPSGKSKLCPLGSGQSCLQFQAWRCKCLCWHGMGYDVTLNCSGGGCMVWERATRGWCSGALMLLCMRRCEATALTLISGGCTEVMLPEKSVLFPVRKLCVHFNLLTQK